MRRRIPKPDGLRELDAPCYFEPRDKDDAGPDRDRIEEGRNYGDRAGTGLLSFLVGDWATPPLIDSHGCMFECLPPVKEAERLAEQRPMVGRARVFGAVQLDKNFPQVVSGVLGGIEQD